jgi:hypothetical protein
MSSNLFYHACEQNSNAKHLSHIINEIDFLYSRQPFTVDSEKRSEVWVTNKYIGQTSCG